MVCQLHEVMMARVTDSGTVSEALAVTNVVRRGYILTPTLLSFMFSVMLADAYHDEPGIRIAYRTGGHILNSPRMRAPTSPSHSLLFANNCTIHTKTEANMQQSIGLFAYGCANFGLTINMDKTPVMHQSSLNAACSVLHIHVNGTQLKTVDKFAYLSRTLSSCFKMYGEVADRIS
nr:unnamed protein product [Spirometra erinaceieuropaei]